MTLIASLDYFKLHKNWLMVLIGNTWIALKGNHNFIDTRRKHLDLVSPTSFYYIKLQYFHVKRFVLPYLQFPVQCLLVDYNRWVRRPHPSRVPSPVHLYYRVLLVDLGQHRWLSVFCTVTGPGVPMWCACGARWPVGTCQYVCSWLRMRGFLWTKLVCFSECFEYVSYLSSERLPLLLSYNLGKISKISHCQKSKSIRIYFFTKQML